MTSPSYCPFCDSKVVNTALWRNNSFFVVEDKHPVEPGHLLIVARSHSVQNIFEVYDSIKEFQEALTWARRFLQTYREPSGFTVVANVGASAGQTVNHGHVHVIPRYGK